MHRLAAVPLLLVAACGSSEGDGTDPPPPPEARCAAPPLRDVTAPTTVVGDGTAASCTQAALADAVAAGGTIVFDCGDGPVTIPVTRTIVVTRDTVLDGGGTVTLDGEDAARILYLDSDYNTPTPRLVVQRLTFTRGRSPAEGEDTAQGGAAIYRDGGSLEVLDCTFDDNHGPSTGQDVAGGAIYGFGGGETVVAGSTFVNNSASDGGAIGSLNSDLTIINSTLSNNAALGTGGNPGNGGAGGAIYMDGRDELASLCGVTIASNTAGAIGGGVFRVSNDGTGRVVIDRAAIVDNRVTPTDSGNAGGLYLQGLALRVTNTSIARNAAFYGGGIWIHDSAAELENVTIAENTATGSNGGGVWLGDSPTGVMRNCTIARNRSTGDATIAGAIFGEGMTLVNTVVAENTAMYTPGCNASHGPGATNLQWPDGALCSDGPLVADPQLGALVDRDGMLVALPAATSPAVALATACPETDQLGRTRPMPCTAGAVEPD